MLATSCGRKIVARTVLDDATRLREEDPFTDLLTSVGGRGGGAPLAVRGRPNRPREKAVYRVPRTRGDSSCGGDAARHGVERSLALYDEFYAELGARLDDARRAARSCCSTSTPTTTAATAPTRRRPPPTENPEVNVGTGCLDRDVGARVVDRFIDDLAAPRRSAATIGRARERPLPGRRAQPLGATSGTATGLRAGDRVQEDVHGRVDRRAVDERHSRSLRDALAAVGPRARDRGAATRRRRDGGRLRRLDLAVDRRCPTSPTSFRFLLDVTPVDLVERATAFWRPGRAPEFAYRDARRRPCGRHDAGSLRSRSNDVEDPTVAHLLQAKHRELLLLVQMLSCRAAPPSSSR